jgi:hypothetical protein
MGDTYTPNPKGWILDGENIRDGDGRMVACCCYTPTSTEGMANAACLLRAAQSHADLRAACEKWAAFLAKYGRQIEELFGHDEQYIAADEALNAALAKAKH